MLAEQIKDVKAFMEKLLIGNSFDTFLVDDISITTYNTFHIDGHLRKEFYTEDERAKLPDETFSEWAKLKPFCFSIIKGKKTPLHFKMIFVPDRQRVTELLASCDTTLTLEDIHALFLNIRYEQGTLSYVTGCSLKIFTTDRSLEQAFDRYIQTFIDSL